MMADRPRFSLKLPCLLLLLALDPASWVTTAQAQVQQPYQNQPIPNPFAARLPGGGTGQIPNPGTGGSGAGTGGVPIPNPFSGGGGTGGTGTGTGGTGAGTGGAPIPNPFSGGGGTGGTGTGTGGTGAGTGGAPAPIPNPFSGGGGTGGGGAGTGTGGTGSGTGSGTGGAVPNPFSNPQPIQQGTGNTAVCPGDDGKTYFTPTGLFFKIQCGRLHGTKVIQRSGARSLQECIDKCGDEPNCKSVAFQAFQCALMSETGASVAENERNMAAAYAYQVDPPTQPEKDEEIVACSTTCPSGNGQSYSSSWGETFRINCGKRHGTTYLKQETHNTLQDCMDACAAYIPCHSVDYHQASGTCYFSNHHGEPTISTPGFSSAYSLGCTGACSSSNGSCSSSCCGCSTTAKKPPGPPTPDLSCGNQGVQWAIYPNKKPDGANNLYTDNTYSSFEPTLFKPATAEYTGKTKIVAASDVTNIYGNAPSSSEYVTVNHRGYIFAQQAGEYTFTIPSSDDITLLWVGPTAYSGWTRANAKIIQPFVQGGQTPISYKETFTAGQYVPIRIMWANGGGPGSFTFELKAPDGTVIIGGKDGKESPFLVQYSCDRTSAPRYPPFGSET